MFGIHGLEFRVQGIRLKVWTCLSLNSRIESDHEEEKKKFRVGSLRIRVGSCLDKSEPYQLKPGCSNKSSCAGVNASEQRGIFSEALKHFNLKAMTLTVSYALYSLDIRE